MIKVVTLLAGLLIASNLMASPLDEEYHECYMISFKGDRANLYIHKGERYYGEALDWYVIEDIKYECLFYPPYTLCKVSTIVQLDCPLDE